MAKDDLFYCRWNKIYRRNGRLSLCQQIEAETCVCYGCSKPFFMFILFTQLRMKSVKTFIVVYRNPTLYDIGFRPQGLKSNTDLMFCLYMKSQPASCTIFLFFLFEFIRQKRQCKVVSTTLNSLTCEGRCKEMGNGFSRTGQAGLHINIILTFSGQAKPMLLASYRINAPHKTCPLASVRGHITFQV